MHHTCKFCGSGLSQCPAEKPHYGLPHPPKLALEKKYSTDEIDDIAAVGPWHSWEGLLPTYLNSRGIRSGGSTQGSWKKTTTRGMRNTRLIQYRITQIIFGVGVCYENRYPGGGGVLCREYDSKLGFGAGRQHNFPPLRSPFLVLRARSEMLPYGFSRSGVFQSL